MKTLAAAGLLLALSGCVFVIEDEDGSDPGPRYYGDGDEDEVRYVIYREYYGCDPHEVAVIRHYRVYYGYDDCDLWFLLFLARRCDVSLHVVVRRYELCGRRMHVLVRDFGCEPDIFFVYVRDVDRCPPPYGRAYGYWHRRQLHAVELSNDEYRALVDLRIAHDYYGYTPEEFFARCGPDRPCRVLFRDYRNCGRGGKDARMRPCVKRERPWEMSRAERERWKRECKEREAEEHARFKREHREQVEAYERRHQHDNPHRHDDKSEERRDREDRGRSDDRSTPENRDRKDRDRQDDDRRGERRTPPERDDRRSSEDRSRSDDRSTPENRDRREDRGRSDSRTPSGREDRTPPKDEPPRNPPKKEPPKEEKKGDPNEGDTKGKGKDKK